MGVCILIQVGLLGLAILSRIHFSKYKDGDIKQFRHMRETIQAVRVIPRQEAEVIVRKCVKQMVWAAIIILFVSTCIAEGMIWNERRSVFEAGIVKRESYDGEVKTEDIRLSVDDKDYTYTIEVAPREYTENEFYQKAQTQITNLEMKILGDNPDLDHVTGPLILPTEDEAGVFTYTWKSDNPAVVSPYGKVDLEEIEGTVLVLLTVEISYRTYMVEHVFPVSVVRDMRRKDAVEQAEEELQRIEKETRTDENLRLPEQFAGVDISLQRQERKWAMTWVFFGILLVGMLPVWMHEKYRKERKKRNSALIGKYASFVNSLWLLLGSGMTVQMGIRHIISEMKEDNLLKRELEYAMHQLDTGSEESFVYEQLGRRLELPEYSRLLQQISQHIRMGTKDLRNLMEQQLQQALQKRRELAKKKGEEASTKLLFPMIVLLVLVILIIIYPAFAGL